MTETKKNSSEDRLWAAASYLWVISLVALAARKNSDFVRFHASQGALLFVVSVVLMFIPVIGWLLNLIVGVTAIIGIVKALQGQRWPLPVGAELAARFGNWIMATLKL